MLVPSEGKLRLRSAPYPSTLLGTGIRWPERTSGEQRAPVLHHRIANRHCAKLPRIHRPMCLPWITLAKYSKATQQRADCVVRKRLSWIQDQFNDGFFVFGAVSPSNLPTFSSLLVASCGYFFLPTQNLGSPLSASFERPAAPWSAPLAKLVEQQEVIDESTETSGACVVKRRTLDRSRLSFTMGLGRTRDEAVHLLPEE